LAGIFYTGGTTGRSKGVMVSHANLVTNFFLVQAVQPYAPDTVFLHVAPMFHMADASCLFGLSQLAATHVILPGFEPEATIQSIERQRVTALLLVPTMIARLCDTLEAQGGDMSSVRRLFYGASPISAGVLRRAMALLRNAEFSQGYGQTEVSCCLTLLDHQDHLDGRLESAGRPLPACDVRVVDTSMKDVPEGEVGEIITRGPCVMLGYWEQPEATADSVVDGWLMTGDAGRFDANGYLYLVDRVKDMIVSGGENVFSVEVERALMTHPDIVQCAVIGVPDPQWGERVHAILYVREGANIDEAALRAHCDPRIARYKQPKSLEVRREPLPLSAMGKIAKAELRKPFWANDGRAIA
jgi:long-chain acyl-CoA synthetase